MAVCTNIVIIHIVQFQCRLNPPPSSQKLKEQQSNENDCLVKYNDHSLHVYLNFYIQWSLAPVWHNDNGELLLL